MNLIKKINYLIVFLTLRYIKKIERSHAKLMAETYIYFKYNK